MKITNDGVHGKTTMLNNVCNVFLYQKVKRIRRINTKTKYDFLFVMENSC